MPRLIRRVGRLEACEKQAPEMSLAERLRKIDCDIKGEIFIPLLEGRNASSRKWTLAEIIQSIGE
jgi:hypothetical protein